MNSTAFDKIRDARNAAARIDLDFRSMSDRRNDFFVAIAALRTAFQRIEHETKNRAKGKKNAKQLRSEVDRWWKKTSDDAWADPLMKWVFETRNDDHHIAQGDDPLVAIGGWSTDLGVVTTEDDAVYGLDAHGQYVRIDDYGTSDETITPMNPALSKTTGAQRWEAQNPPMTHDGSFIVDRRPSALLTMAADYLSRVLDESHTVTR